MAVGGGDARISFEEFKPFYQNLVGKKPQGDHDDYVEGLKVFDKDGSGQIAVSELRHVLTSLGEKLDDAEVDQLLQNMKADPNGSVNCHGRSFAPRAAAAAASLSAAARANEDTSLRQSSSRWS